MYNKVGAMFGLDARIALAIFGALSVISGAALYSAIQEAKLVAIYTEMNEVSKAFESLYIDTGSIRTYGSDKSLYNAEDLFTDNNLAGWSGPYLAGDFNNDGTNSYLINSNIPEGYDLRVRNTKVSSWSPGLNWNSDIKCLLSSSQCSFTLQFMIAKSYDTLGQELDSRFDDGVADTGRIRFGKHMTASVYYIYILFFNINSK